MAGLTHAKAVYRSVYGRIVSEWQLNKDKMEVIVEIPVNTRAHVYLPKAEVPYVLESGCRLEGQQGIRYYMQSGDTAVLEIGSGTYKLTYPITL